MIANVGTVDRALRLAVGAALIALALFSGAGLIENRIRPSAVQRVKAVRHCPDARELRRARRRR